MSRIHRLRSPAMFVTPGCVSDRAFGLLCPGERESRGPVSSFRDYQSVIQAGVRRGDATRRGPLDPEEVRALFGRMVRRGWTPAEIDLLDRAACAAMLERGPAAPGQVTGK